MSTVVLEGLALTLLAGALAGNCMLPMKFARRWQWENVWLVFSIVSLLILPWALALTLAGNLGEIYGGHDSWPLLPLFFKNREVLGTSRGALILAGLAVMVAGIAVSARAGGQREQGRKPEAGAGYALALAMAVFCGLLAPMINYSFAFGQDIAVRAIKLGISPERAGYAVWPVTLAGGLLPNLGYCLYLLFRKKTWSLFRGPWLPDAGHATLMAVFWMGAMSVYGVAAVYLGALGTSVGWGLFQIFMIMTANFGGVITGEWAAAPRSALRTLYAGLGLLAVATLMLAGGDR